MDDDTPFGAIRKKKRGPPSQPGRRVLYARIDAEDYERIDAMFRPLGFSTRAALVRKALKSFIAQHAHKASHK